MEPSATSTTVTGPDGEHLQAGTEDAPVLDRPAPLRRLHDFDTGYKYPDLVTYLLTYLLTYYNLPNIKKSLVFMFKQIICTALLKLTIK